MITYFKPLEDPCTVPEVKQSFDLQIQLPGSKSIALRQLLISALASGPSELQGIPVCDDVDAMLRTLGKLGVKTTTKPGDNTYTIDPDDLDLSSNVNLDLHMSGVSLRLLIAMSGLRHGITRLEGHQQLAARPNHDLLAAMSSLGCAVTAIDGKLPIEIEGPITSGQVNLSSHVSSQYLTALLLAAPRMTNGLTIRLTDPVSSASYVEITTSEMAKRNVEVSWKNDLIQVKPQSYDGKSILIEGDASAATYYAALATLHKSKVSITNLGDGSKQGDLNFLTLCQQMGATIERTSNTVTIEGPRNLKPIDAIDMSNMPDAAPTLFAMAPYLPKPIHITGLSTLRHKECDRLGCSAVELRKAGVTFKEGPDFATIAPSETNGAVFNTYQDHRMAMSLAVFGTRTQGCQITDPNCVSKTYTDFWNDLSRIYSTDTNKRPDSTSIG